MYVEHQIPPIPVGYEQATADPITVGTLTLPTNARYAKIRVASAAGKYRDDGTSPTSASGYPLAVSDDITLTSAEQISAFEFICASADETVLDVLYYKIRS